MKYKAEDFGLEPNVTGFEEAVNLAYLDGKREGYNDSYDEGYDDGYDEAISEIARNLIDNDVAEEIISRVTGLDLKTLRKLK